MKKVIFPIIAILLLLSNYSIAQFKINTPVDYLKQNSNETGVIYAAQKINNGTIVSSFEVKINDDWSFKNMTNAQYIEASKKSSELDDYGENFLNEFRILIKKEFYFKSVGDTYMVQYKFNENGHSIVNTTIQFIKNSKLYTCIGSTVASLNRQSFNEYLKMIESIQL
jgi:hypothetical protein